MAASEGHLDLILKISVLAKEILTTEEIKIENLFLTDHEGRTTWHIATYEGNLDLIQKIWEWG